jgi:hypothetical protein
LGTLAPAIARLNAEMDKALADSATGKKSAANRNRAGRRQYRVARARCARADSDKYARLARELNIKAN